jgi:hypothetical protein
VWFWRHRPDRQDSYASEDDDVFLDLYERFPTWDDTLAAVRKHKTFKQFRKFAEMGLSTLKPEEIDKALDENVVPWRKFHEDIVQSCLLLTCLGGVQN